MNLLPHLRPLATLAVSVLSVTPSAFAAAPAAPAPAPAPAEKTPGQSAFGTARHIEYLVGDLPLVLTSPHGGRLIPDTIPNRTYGTVLIDTNTQELARALAAELHTRTGHHAHLIVSHLHRSKLDPNRELKEAAQGNPAAELAWREFHTAIRTALAAAVARHGFAFLVDLHGHAHPIARLELGYALDAKQINPADPAFDTSGLIALSTLSDLAARVGGSPSALLRGPRSLGDLFATRGLPAIPSPQDPRPGEEPFFAGGYIVREHAAAPGTPHVDGLQIECHRVGVRDTAENRAKFARIAADSLLVFLQERYAYTPRKK